MSTCLAWVLILLSLFGPPASLCAKILVLSSVSSLSHSLWLNELSKLLIENDHEVTFLDIFPNEFEHPKLTRIMVPEASVDDFESTDLDAMSEETSLPFILDLLYKASQETCSNIKNSAGIRQLMKKYSKVKRPFDMIIHDGSMCEFLLGFVHIYEYPPLVTVSAFGAPQHLLFTSGNYFNPAFVPQQLSIFSHPMSFQERLLNLYYVYYQAATDHGEYTTHQKRLAQELFGKEVPDVYNIKKSSKLFLLNSMYLLDGIRHDPPNVINVGGFQVPLKRTPTEPAIEAFLDGGKDGVIYFSFGSNIMTSDMSEEKINIFLSVFRELPQRVLWKWNKEPIKNLPPNVMLTTWVKQADVLAHRNVKVFISHGGLLGTQESVFFGVPMLILPFILDQFAYAERLQKIGGSIRMCFKSLTKHSLKESLLKLLEDPSYSTTMKELSSVIRDMPQNPRETMRSWIEFVLRHPNSTILQSPAVNMPLYQLLLLDVLAFFLVILLVTLFAIKLAWRYIVSKASKIKIN